MNKSPVTVYDNGSQVWYLNGKLHREDGPAIERADGSRKWYLNGKRHREDGPAVEWVNGDCEWWVNDKRVSKSEHAQAVLLAKWGLTA